MIIANSILLFSSCSVVASVYFKWGSIVPAEVSCQLLTYFGAVKVISLLTRRTQIEFRGATPRGSVNLVLDTTLRGAGRNGGILCKSRNCNKICTIPASVSTETAFRSFGGAVLTLARSEG